MAEEQNKSTLGLSDEDLKELGVELPKADETTKKIKKVKKLFLHLKHLILFDI